LVLCLIQRKTLKQQKSAFICGDYAELRKWIIAVLVSAGLIFLLILWAPWITDDYAINRVAEILGGPETCFNYLGEDMAIKDIPKEVSWFPFGRYVTFPGEAGWLVNFYGAVS
jgi:hypothetical protein